MSLVIAVLKTCWGPRGSNIQQTIRKQTPKSQPARRSESHPCKAAAQLQGISVTTLAVWKQSGTVS